MSLSEMSNTELISHLRRSLADRSWTPVEFVEAERRGEDCLDSDPELADAFWARRDQLVAPVAEAFRAAYEPTRLALERLAGTVMGPELSGPERLLDLPSLAGSPDTQILAVLERSDCRLAAIEAHTGRDRVDWVQFFAVIAGVVLAFLALVI
jgi:hypothetical protein